VEDTSLNLPFPFPWSQKTYLSNKISIFFIMRSSLKSEKEKE